MTRSTPTSEPGDATVADDDPDRPEALLRDVQVLHELEQAGFAGPAWAAHSDDTFGYAHRVVRGWARDGSLFGRMRGDSSIAQRDRERLPARRKLRDDEIADLVGYLMMTAIPAYRANLVKGRWRPELGRGLRSYAVQQLKFQLARRYWKWVEQRAAEAERPEAVLSPGHTLVSALHGDVYAWCDPEEAVVLAETIKDDIVRAALGDPLTVRIAALNASDYQDNEIAEVVDVSVKTVELRLRRFRARAAVNRRIVA